MKLLKYPEKIKLNDGREMPEIGFGTCRLSASRTNIDTETEQAVKNAIDAGYRLIDTAYLYWTEAAVGRAIRHKINEGVIERKDIFIVTKLWCTFHDHDRVQRACQKSLKNLGLDYIDLYLMHAPIGFKYTDEEKKFPIKNDRSFLLSDVDYVDTWKGMENLVKLGMVKSIGVSNFTSQQLGRILNLGNVKPVINQIECCPGLNQKKLIKFCKEYDINVTAYYPLGRPNMEKRVPNYFFDEAVAEIGRKYNKTIAQVILRYVFQLGTIPIPRSTNKSRIEENINIFDFQLNEMEMQFMDTFNTGQRTVAFQEISQDKYFPFRNTHNFIK